MSSSVSIQVPTYGYTYTFSGILSVKHELSLKIQTDADSETGTDYVNGARNQPNKVILNVIESDVGHLAGWATRMMQAMESLKRTRTLCNVVTAGFIYSGMLLSEFTATEDETSQSGWQGTLVFTQYVPVDAKTTAKIFDNSSTATHTGSAGPVVVIVGSELENLLLRAGIG